MSPSVSSPTNVLAASDDNAFIGLLAMLASVVLNHEVDIPLHIYVIDCGLSDSNVVRLEKTLYSLSDKVVLFREAPDFSQLANLRTGAAGLYTYARLLSAEVFPQLQRVIYIDTDIIVNRDLRPLFLLPLRGKPIAAAQDRFSPTASHPLSVPDWIERGYDSHDPYFNAGLMLIDYSLWRSKDIGGRAIKFARDNPEICIRWDQTILNILLYRDWLPLDPLWNYMVYSNIEESWVMNDRNFHITGQPKQWDMAPRTNAALQTMFWSYLDLTAAAGWRPWSPQDEHPFRLWLQGNLPVLHRFWKLVRPHLFPR